MVPLATPKPVERPTATVEPAKPPEFAWEKEVLIPQQNSEPIAFPFLTDMDDYMFYHNPEGHPTALKLGTKEQVWTWEKRGTVLSGDKVNRFAPEQNDPDYDFVYILGEDRNIYAVEATSGKTKWQTTLSDDEKTRLRSVKVLKDRIYLQLKDKFLAVAKNSGKTDWPKMGYLSFLSRGKTLILEGKGYLDWQTGEERPTSELFAQTVLNRFSAVSDWYENEVFSLTRTTKPSLLIFDRQTGGVLWKQDLETGTESASISFTTNQRVYVHTRGKNPQLIAYDHKEKRLLWKIPAPEINPSVHENKGVAYITLPDFGGGKLAAYDTQTGEPKWPAPRSLPSDTNNATILDFTGNIIAVWAQKKDIHVHLGFDIISGSQRWRYDEREQTHLGWLTIGRWRFSEAGYKLKVLDLATGTLIPHNVQGKVTSLGKTYDTVFVVTGEQGKTGKIVAIKIG